MKEEVYITWLCMHRLGVQTLGFFFVSWVVPAEDLTPDGCRLGTVVY